METTIEFLMKSVSGQPQGTEMDGMRVCITGGRNATNPRPRGPWRAMWRTGQSSPYVLTG